MAQIKKDSYEADNILPGIKPVLELLVQNPKIVAKILFKEHIKNPALKNILDLGAQLGIPHESVPTEHLDLLCQNGQKKAHINHQGVIAILSGPQSYALEDIFALVQKSPLPLILALDQIQDPGNLGTLCRTAYALGCAGIILPRHNSSHPGAAAMRSSAGALNKLPYTIVTNLARALDSAAECGLTIYGSICDPAPMHGSSTCINAFHHQWKLPAVLVLGNENRGIRAGVAKRCENNITIPLFREFDSLNIAQAGAILIGLCAENYGK